MQPRRAWAQNDGSLAEFLKPICMQRHSKEQSSSFPQTFLASTPIAARPIPKQFSNELWKNDKTFQLPLPPATCQSSSLLRLERSSYSKKATSLGDSKNRK